MSALPTAIFGPAMGIQGLALVVFHTEQWLHPAAMVLSGISLLILAISVLAHAVKLIRFPVAGRNDLRTPAFVCFYGQPGVTVLLAAEIFQGSARVFAAVLTSAGAVIAASSALALVHARDRVPEPGNPMPPQLIPGIACLMVPITAHDFLSEGWCWTILGAAAAVLATFYLAAPVGFPKLPAPLAPTAAIHLAAPAVACVDLAELLPHSPFDRIALGVTGFVFAGLVIRGRRLVSAPFGLPWWAFTMPFSAVILALGSVISPDGNWWAVIRLGLVVNALLVVVVGGRTIAALARGTLLPAVPAAISVPKPVAAQFVSTAQE